MSRCIQSLPGFAAAKYMPFPSAELIDDLLCPEAWPHAVDRIELIETHISWVLLTGRYAYKIKKPVELGFLDFRDLEQRRFYCEEELRLNRFWAPELYLDVVPITREGGTARVGADGEPVEYAVRMRQFDQSQRLDHELERGRLDSEDMLELAAEVSARHAEAPRAGRPGRLLLTTKKLMWENFEDLIGETGHERVAALHRWTKAQLERHGSTLAGRCREGFYRECHGDLHLGNVVRLPDRIKAFDCIEFNEDLRRIDTVADYSFLVMDLAARGRTDLAFTFLNRYLEISGDYAGASLVPLYVVYRSLVRAKVAAIRRRERSADDDGSEDTEAIEHYCTLARTWTKRRKPSLVLMTGLAGSGKTWLSSQLVGMLPALRVRSDLERKRLSGIAETADSHSGLGSGIYDRQTGRQVYRRMLDNARPMLDSGFDVILDATFLEAAERERARQFAASCGAGFVIVETIAPRAVLEERVGRRAASGTDASEAGSNVLHFQLEKAEPLDAAERLCTEVVRTHAAPDVARLVDRLRRRMAGRGRSSE